MINQEKINSCFLEYFSKLNAPAKFKKYLLFERSDTGSPHVEISTEGCLSYVVTERGSELKRKTANNLDELMYWIFSGITHSMASDYARSNRNSHQDLRRVLFTKQVELLGRVSAEWKIQKELELETILKKHPFDDDAFARAMKIKNQQDQTQLK